MIPYATTTITVKGRRPQVAIDPDAAGYDGAPASPVVLVTGLRACISLPSFKRQVPVDQVDTYALRCDTFGLTRYDTVIDESNGIEYQVDSVGPSTNLTFGLAHTVAYISRTKGLVAGGGNGESA